MTHGARRPLPGPRIRLLVLAALGAIASCSDAVTAPRDGRLVLAVTGLPPGVPASVQITGPDGYTLTADGGRVLTDLRRGTYTVAAAPVVTDSARFVPAAAHALQTIEVSGAVAGPVRVGYELTTARLGIRVVGLPAGQQAAISFSDPAGTVRGLATTTATFERLPPNTYTITATAVAAGGTTFQPDPATQSVVLTPGLLPVVATVAYGSGSATLGVSVAGLPATASATVRVTGPAGFDRSVPATQTLRHLEGGTYTVTAGATGSDLVTFRPTVMTQSVDVAAGAASSVSVTYQGTPLSLALELVADGLTAPVFLDAPTNDHRLFILERNGRIRVVDGGTLLPVPYLDITSRVNFVGERGLLGMAFDPRHGTNGRFFVFYVNLAGDVVVERFASTPGSNVAGASEGLVIALPHKGNEHHGGMIAFGPDGMLYVGPGDGGCCGDPGNHAQNRASWLGKLLRLDVRTLPYIVPPDNPFVGDPTTLPEIWALGLRNPWRFSFDSPAGLLLIGDVGQDAREEVNVSSIATAGLNYGWRFMEGTACYNPATNCLASGPTMTLPAYEYTHADGCSVTGGYVYRGAAIPELTGRYLFADFCRGWLRSFRPAVGGAEELRAWPGVSLPFVVSFGRDGRGELYMVAGSRVWRIVRG